MSHFTHTRIVHAAQGRRCAEAMMPPLSRGRHFYSMGRRQVSESRPVFAVRFRAQGGANALKSGSTQSAVTSFPEVAQAKKKSTKRKQEKSAKRQK
jgi:hypothetical protein